MKSLWTTIEDIWSEKIWLDYLAPVLVLGVHGALVLWLPKGISIFTWPDLAQRLALYSTGAAIVAIFGGLCAVAISVYLSAGGARALATKRLYGRELRRNWRALLIGMGGSAALFLICQSIDRQASPIPAWLIFEFSAAFAAARFVRMVWLFDRILRIADKDLTEKPRLEAPKLDKRWEKKGADEDSAKVEAS